jgi:uncharacterized delta-60 repeat protein
MRRALPILLLLFYTLSLQAQNAGQPDITFGTNGIVLATIIPLQRAAIHKLLQQPDGKIIAIGGTNEYAATSDLALIRYNTDGTRDNSFGVNGIATYNAGGNSFGHTGILLPGGKIAVAGFKNDGIPGNRAIIARFNANGTIDNTYDGDGIMEIGPSTGLHNIILDMEKDALGNYYLCGNFDNGSGNTDIAIVRLTPALTPDNSFGTMGIRQFATDPGVDNTCRAISIQANGKIVGAGYTNIPQGFLFRMNTDGTLDNSFGGTGWFHAGQYFQDVGILSTGDIVVAAHTFSIITNNALDCQKFDTNGNNIPWSMPHRSNRQSNSIIIQDNDQFLITSTTNSSNAFCLSRWDANGDEQDINPDLGSKEVSANLTTAQYNYSVTSLIQEDGKYIVAGTAQVDGSPSTFQFAMIRFLGRAGEITTLPVGLVNFTAERQQQEVKLAWSTSFEQNNKGFEIQRSTNGRDFTKIGWVPGVGNSNDLLKYSFTDQSPAKGNNYYRLNQLDLDGHSRLSAIRKIDFKQLIEFSIYPNPAKDKLTLQFNNAAAKEIRIIDIQGRIRWQQQKVTETLLIVPIQQLSKGAYILQVSGNNGKQEWQKFIKE